MKRRDFTYQIVRTIFGLIGTLVIIIGIYLAVINPHARELQSTASISGNVVVFTPEGNTAVGGSFVATGKARVFENQLNWELLDPDTNTVLASGTANTYASDIGQFGYFSIPIHVPTSFTGSGLTFEAFDYSAKDGAKQNIASIALSYDPAQKTTIIAAYFPNDPQSSQNCDSVFPLYRNVIQTSSTARAALNELLSGPTTQEKESGFFTSIPSGVTIQDISLVNKILAVDFDQTLDQGIAGSCRVVSIRAQIEKTLEQFPSISRVTISVDGRTEDILQP